MSNLFFIVFTYFLLCGNASLALLVRSDYLQSSYQVDVGSGSGQFKVALGDTGMDFSLTAVSAICDLAGTSASGVNIVLKNNFPGSKVAYIPIPVSVQNSSNTSGNKQFSGASNLNFVYVGSSTIDIQVDSEKTTNGNCKVSFFGKRLK